MKTIFLAGPMRGFSDAEGRKITLEWREEAKKILSSHFIVKHAYRGRENGETFSDPKGAIMRDKQDVLNADIIIETFPEAGHGISFMTDAKRYGEILDRALALMEERSHHD